MNENLIRETSRRLVPFGIRETADNNMAKKHPVPVIVPADWSNKKVQRPKTHLTEVYEILNGKVYNMSSPNIDHNNTLTELLCIIKTFLKENNKQEKVCIGMGFSFREDEPKPDLMMVSPEKITNKKVVGVPFFVAEVISSSSFRRDRITKKDIYEKAGVSEYWLVDPQNEAIEVFDLRDGKYKLRDIWFMRYDTKDIISIEEYKPEITTMFYGEELKIKLSDIFET